MIISDRDAAGLRGPVASWELEFIGRNNIVFELYRPDGMLLERRTRAPRFPEHRIVRHYDDAGRLLAEERTGEFPATLEYHYDEHGRLAQVGQVNARDRKSVVELYSYHNDGTSTHTQYIDPPLREQNIGVLEENTLHMSADAVRIFTVRDNHDRPVKKVFYDVDDRVIRRVLLRYDDAGRPIEEGEVEFGGGMRPDMRNWYRYDDSGRCIEAEYRWGAFGGQQKTMEYNELGDLVEERIAPVAGEVTLDDLTPWLRRFSYEYDALGNWTSRTVESCSFDKSVVHHTGQSRRTLTYYGTTLAL